MEFWPQEKLQSPEEAALRSYYLHSLLDTTLNSRVRRQTMFAGGLSSYNLGKGGGLIGRTEMFQGQVLAGDYKQVKMFEHEFGAHNGAKYLIAQELQIYDARYQVLFVIMRALSANQNSPEYQAIKRGQALQLQSLINGLGGRVQTYAGAIEQIVTDPGTFEHGTVKMDPSLLSYANPIEANNLQLVLGAFAQQRPLLELPHNNRNTVYSEGYFSMQMLENWD